MNKKTFSALLLTTILSVAFIISFMGAASAESLMGWQILGPGGNCSESDGVLTFSGDEQAAGATLCKEISPTSNFEISLQVKAATLGVVNRDPGNAGEGFAIALRPDTQFSQPNGVNFEFRARGGGQFLVAWSRNSSSSYPYPGASYGQSRIWDWVPFIYDSPGYNDGSQFWQSNATVTANAPVKPGVWYTMNLIVQQEPFKITAQTLSENGTLMGAFSVSDVAGFPFKDIKVVGLSTGFGGEFYVKNINMTCSEVTSSSPSPSTSPSPSPSPSSYPTVSPSPSLPLSPSPSPSSGLLVARYTYTPNQPAIGQSVTFNASTSTPQTQITTYLWNFGDNSTALTDNPAVSHTYWSSQTFHTTLTVTNFAGANAFTIKDLQVSNQTAASLSMYTSCSATTTGSTVNIYGKLSEADGSALKNQTIVLSYSFEGNNAAVPLSSVLTDENGDYRFQWVNSASGTFVLHVAWFGDSTHPSTGNSASLTFLPYQNQNVFVVESNSTVTSLAFNSTTSELSFTVSGPRGTTGYVKTTIAKTLLPNATDLKVYLDGKQLNYTLTSNGDSWFLTFTYSHSTHQVAVYLPMDSAENHAADTATAAPNPDTTAINYWLLAGIVVAIIVIGILAAFILRGTKKPAENYAFEA